MKMDKSQVRGCEILLVDTSDIVHLGLGECSNMTNQCIVDIVYRCVKLRNIEIGGCGQVTDAGILALSQNEDVQPGCCHLS